MAKPTVKLLKISVAERQLQTMHTDGGSPT
jgi:hypothetical protein